MKFITNVTKLMVLAGVLLGVVSCKDEEDNLMLGHKEYIIQNSNNTFSSYIYIETYTEDMSSLTLTLNGDVISGGYQTARSFEVMVPGQTLNKVMGIYRIKATGESGTVLDKEFTIPASGNDVMQPMNSDPLTFAFSQQNRTFSVEIDRLMMIDEYGIVLIPRVKEGQVDRALRALAITEPVLPSADDGSPRMTLVGTLPEGYDKYDEWSVAFFLRKGGIVQETPHKILKRQVGSNGVETLTFG